MLTLLRCHMRLGCTAAGSLGTDLASCNKPGTPINKPNTRTVTNERNSIREGRRGTVIIGGGVVGVSLAYHLAKRGADVLLLEKTDLTAGSTWHAAGLVTLYHPTPNVKRVHWDSMNLYSQLEGETGQEVGFHRPGSLRLATSPVRADEAMYAVSRQAHKPAPMRWLNPDEVEKMVPILNMDGVLGGVLTPGEGHIDPYSLTQALAIGARARGAQILQQTEVTDVCPLSDGGWEVTTSSGVLTADSLVNAAGFWGREVGAMAELSLPLVPVQHQYFVTKTVPEVEALEKEIPVLRHLDGSFYLRQERQGLLIGPYESRETMVQCSEWATDKVTPGFGRELFPPDLDRLQPHLEAAMEAFPCLQAAEIQTVVNGPITYTPDLLPMVGLTQLPNLYVAVGFGYGIVHGGGIGRYLSDWICDGHPPYELIELDPLRYGKWTTIEYALAKTRESYGMNNAVTYPDEERPAGRPTSRVTPIHEQLVAAGAHMGFSSGWEVPTWYSGRPEYRPSFRRTNWHEEQAGEYELVTSRVAVADLSPFAKLWLRGPDCRAMLDRAVAGTVPRQGRTSLVHMLTPAGKVYAELTVTCLGEEEFLVVTGAGSELHDQRGLAQVVSEGGYKVDIINRSDEFGVLSVVGPQAEQVMERLAGREAAEMKFLQARQFPLGGNASLLAIKISYTGELGFEIYTEMENLKTLYEAILEAGQPFGIGHIGTRVNTLRIEKGFRAWGHEMNKDISPLEAGLMPFVKLNKKADFIGKPALLEALRRPLDRQLVFLSVDSDPVNVDPAGDEAVEWEGKPVGYTTSGCYSPAVGGSLAMAYLPPFLAVPGAEVSVRLLEARPRASVLEGAPALTHQARARRTAKPAVSVAAH